MLEQQQRNQQMMTEILVHVGQNKGNGESSPPPIFPVIQGGTNIQFNPKVEFPSFDGTDSKSWIKKCTRYFGLYRTPDNQKVDLASLHLKGSAEIWFGGYIMGRKGVIWEEFIVDVCARFRDDLGSKVVEEFNVIIWLNLKSLRLSFWLQLLTCLKHIFWKAL